MPPVRPFPPIGSALVDARGGDRTLRVSWHPESAVAVLSVWPDTVCTASFRLGADEDPDLIDLLTRGLADSCDNPATALPA